MPLNGGNYVAPKWVDNAAPALDAKELQAMCDSIVKNQGDAAELKKAVDALTSAVGGNLRMQVLSYVGTGAFGENNPCSITVDFPIRALYFLGCVSVASRSNNYTEEEICGFMFADGLKTEYISGAGISIHPRRYSFGKKSIDGKTFSWFNDISDGAQANSRYSEYFFLAIEKK